MIINHFLLLNRSHQLLDILYQKSRALLVFKMFSKCVRKYLSTNTLILLLENSKLVPHFSRFCVDLKPYQVNSATIFLKFLFDPYIYPDTIGSNYQVILIIYISEILEIFSKKSHLQLPLNFFHSAIIWHLAMVDSMPLGHLKLHPFQGFFLKPPQTAHNHYLCCFLAPLEYTFPTVHFSS